MGTFLNPQGINAFIKLVNNRKNGVFVDKTNFIGETIKRLDTELNLIAFTRPRRFGKTTMAKMLAAYYSKGNNNEHIFAKLDIANFNYIRDGDEQDTEVTFTTYLNKFDVIYIDMNTVKMRYQTYLEEQNHDQVLNLKQYIEYLVISELKANSTFAPILEQAGIKNVGLAKALLAIHNSDSPSKFIFIMDEWDLVYRDYRDDTKLQKDFIELLRGLFKSDCVDCFSLVYLTGILPIKKYNSQSALNNFDEYNMLTPKSCAEYFGFTEAEVATIVQQPFCHLSQETLKDWYEGYKLKGIDVYNPNSVAKAIAENECLCYWSNTSSNEDVSWLLNMKFDGVKDKIIALLEDAKCTFNYSQFQNDMVSINTEDDVICLLVCLGYLGCTDTKNQGVKQAYVPNQEIKIALMNIVNKQPWYRSMDTIKRSEQLLQAIKELDGTTVATLIQKIHNSQEVSIFDYNNEKSLTYCVMTGLLWATLDKYEIHREEHAGIGLLDVVYEPLGNQDPVILIEFKYDCSAEIALAQIKTKEYYTRYQKYRTIILVGINYDSKTKVHQCVLEKITNR